MVNFQKAVKTEQKIRAFLFYVSVAAFCLGLPAILSSALGYKFDRRTFKFTRTGLIAIKTQPPGAAVYFDRQLLAETTPATLDELLPGTYDVRLELENHYPWESPVRVEAGKVTRLERIILFRQRPDIKKLNKESISAFWVDQDKDTIYYVNQEAGAMYRSDLSGEHFEHVADFAKLAPSPSAWRLSPDRGKVIYFNEHQIGVAGLERGASDSPDPSFFINSTAKIVDAFWYSDSYHIILVTVRSIEVAEAKPDAASVLLVTLSRKNTSCWYDPRGDTLYFFDYQRAADGRLYNNLYKLDLRARISPLRELMQQKSDE